jgi:histidinol phosphatase-like enzyme (inositol monophosphatase family)
MSTRIYMEAVAEVARAAGDTALTYYGRNIAIDSKADGSPVTAADRSAEQCARSWIASRFPLDGIVGEEFGIEGDGRARKWIIDPIDGTKSFVRGVPLWGTLVAVVEGDTVLAGAAYFPALSDIVCAGAGEGCWWNDNKCSVSPVATLSEAALLTSAPLDDARWSRLTSQAPIVRTWGDCYGYFLVATGRAEVMVDPALSAWDIAAFIPVITEAGGVITDWQGRSPVNGGSAIATNSVLARQVRTILDVPSGWEEAQ